MEADQAAHFAAERRVAAANASAHAARVAAESAHRRAVAVAVAAEVAAAASSAMLTEDPSSGRSALSPLRQVWFDSHAPVLSEWAMSPEREQRSAIVTWSCRVRRDHWRGMTPEQRAAFPLWQLQQIEQHEAQQRVRHCSCCQGDVNARSCYGVQSGTFQHMSLISGYIDVMPAG